MSSQLEELAESWIPHRIASAAWGYLQVGLDTFHEARLTEWWKTQLALGNLAIGSELMIKAFLARKNLALICANPSPEMLASLIRPKDIDPRVASPVAVELRFSTFKTIEIEDCLKHLYYFLPHLRQSLGPHLQRLAQYRNVSVHSFLPDMRGYEAKRAAYAAIKLFEELKKEKVFGEWRTLGEKSVKFVSSFDEERLERVREEIEKAKRKASALLDKPKPAMAGSWDEYITNCSVCGNEGIAVGTSRVEAQYPRKSPEDVALVFDADAFTCAHCGLELDDAAEMQLAGLDVSYDRSEDLDEWNEQHAYDYIPDEDDDYEGEED